MAAVQAAIVQEAVFVIAAFVLFLTKSAAGPLSDHGVIQDDDLALSAQLVKREFNAE